ncbi:MAG: histidine--tRNA ligase [Fidelibacterota bacterium]
MTAEYRSVRGMRDLLPEETRRWRELENSVHGIMARWGYGEIRTPVFEQTELFTRSVGEDSDIVSKQMYTFQDRSKTSLTLKPELTAPVMRAYIQHRLDRMGVLTKLYYIDSLFRRERPQAGRLRQFRQFGAEAIGSPHPEQDAEIIALAFRILKELGLESLTLQISSIGSPKTRARYRDVLLRFLSDQRDKLSRTSQERLKTNPLRILDTKDPEERRILREAPSLLDYLDHEDLAHYRTVKENLTGLDIPFEEAPILVRGLDYYSRTTFEISHPELGAQNALCGGGRYDGLIQDLGGEPTPAVGFATGIERVLLALEKTTPSPAESPRDIYVVAATGTVIQAVSKLAAQLRDAGFTAQFDTLRRSLKAQMREANRLNCAHAVIIGEEELGSEQVQVKNLTTGQQLKVKMNSLVSYLANSAGPPSSSD